MLIPNRRLKTRVVVYIVILLVIVMFAGGLMYGVTTKDRVINVMEKKSLPTPIEYEVIKDAEIVPENTYPTEIQGRQEKENVVSEVNLAVPFSPQAPHANWDQPYQDACEEAVLIMVSHYLDGTFLSADHMDSEILKMVAWENKFFGSAKDTNIAETTLLVNNYYPILQAKAIYDITVEDIKKELRQGKAVVVLANGQLLGNPYYKQPGPEKHALVIKGFTKDKFITNDPGTRRGADFVYTTQKLYGAIVDYDGNKAGTGKKAMIIISTK